MIFIMFDARPDSEELRHEYGGAVINCWVNVCELSDGERVAREDVKEFGWRIVTVDHIERIAREHQCESGLCYFDEAIEDGASYVVHTWPRISLVESDE